MSEFYTSSVSKEPRYSEPELLRISQSFHDMGYAIPVAEIEHMDITAIQRLFVELSKDEGLDFEERGQQVFGESWQVDKWI